MGRKKTIAGLYKRGQIWYIDKVVCGRRLCESTGTGDIAEAERYLAKRIEDTRQALIYGIRPQRSFKEAATKYLLENQHKMRLNDDAYQLRTLMPFIGDLTLDKIHMGKLQAFCKKRQQDGLKASTINHGLAVVRRILNLAAGEWIDDNGLTWLHHAPKIKLLPKYDDRPPYPITWEEQKRLFAELPAHLRLMAIFAVNTGCRNKEVCSLRWEWEIAIPELETSVFVLPAFTQHQQQRKQIVKNGQDKLVVLNKRVKQIIDNLRGQHPDYVFSYKGKPIAHGMNNTAWQRARKKVGLPHVRVHDLRHTFGSRLRAAGVGLEDREDLLGHKSTRMTTHYSAAEIGNLLKAVNTLCEQETDKPRLTVLRMATS